jgi:hypothetical protein
VYSNSLEKNPQRKYNKNRKRERTKAEILFLHGNSKKILALKT